MRENTGIRTGAKGHGFEMTITTVRQRAGIAAIAVLVLGASLTGCIHLPPSVAAEMQPATPPASNHYRKPPDAERTPAHVSTAP